MFIKGRDQIAYHSDSQSRIGQIRDTLERTCGKDNYNIIILLGGAFGDDDFDDDYEGDGDEGD
ncbi:MAG TPA: hypothetical protein VI479_10265 [Blastocatellia bacterium]